MLLRLKENQKKVFFTLFLHKAVPAFYNMGISASSCKNKNTL